MRQKRTVRTIILTLIITLLLVGGVGFFFVNNIVKQKDARIVELEAQKADAKCYAFANDLREGSIITQYDLVPIDIKSISKTSGMYLTTGKTWTDENGEIHQYATRYTSVVDADGIIHESEIDVLLDQELVGRVVKSNVSKNTPILDSLLYAKEGADAKDIRFVELNDNYLTIATDLQKGDYFDVRIQFPEGQDYSVLIGKKAEELTKDDMGTNTGSGVYAKLSEEEILLLGSAIIEAYMEPGVRLYSTRYADPATQLYYETIEDYVKKYEDGLEAAIEYREFLEIQKAISASGDFTMDFDTYKALAKEEKLALKESAARVNEKDITEDEIARFAGIAVEHVKAIRKAKEAGEDATALNVLNYYRGMRVQRRKSITKTYAVRDEVLEVVKNNPNLVETIKAEFNTRALAKTRIDKYKKLEAQLATAPETSYDSNIKSKGQIQSEMESLLTTRAENVETEITKEITEQKARRVAYLQSLINQ